MSSETETSDEPPREDPAVETRDDEDDASVVPSSGPIVRRGGPV